MANHVRVRLLGPVDVLADGIPRPVRGLRRKAVLAALALQPGEIVSSDRLVDIVWGDGAPATAATTLQSHVSHLRGVLGDRAAILARPPGYVLTIDAEVTDVQAAELLIRQGTESRDPGEREARLRAAVALWRGRPLADLAELAWFHDPAQRLEHLLRQARHVLIDTRLTLGQHAHLIPELADLGRQFPLDEQIHRQLILALYRAGRQGDALATYQQLRSILHEDLGIDPSQPLRDLEAAILRQDPTLDVPSPSSHTVSGGVPAQLPPAITAFTGRGDELAHLDGLLPTAHNRGPAHPTAVVISAISGTAGIGKTALAVHWAHRVATRFPDGQLYVNLRGFDPGGSMVDAAEAVRGFLDAFSVPAQQMPTGLDAQVGLYRSLLAGKRVLVVLDNARDVEQVRPLLPGSDGCMVIVTSRNQLTPLVAAEGAHPVTLDLLTTAEARDLLTHRLGADRVAGEPDAVDDIITRCARLPLALAIAAARAATHPGFPLAALATELHHTAGSLDALHGGDLATDVRTVFSWSYQTLGTDAARMFRLLGQHPGPDITAPAAASLAAVAPQQAHKLLAELTRAHLLSEHIPGRYTFHDLLRAYATELAHTHESDRQQHASLHRMLDHYLHTTYTGGLLLYPKWDPLTFPPPQPGVTPETFDSHDGALTWFAAEYPVLVAAIEQAAAAGFDTHTWQLAWVFTTFLLRRGRFPEGTAVQHIALDAARRLGDRLGQGHILRSLALGYERTGHFDEADTHFRQALQMYTDLGHHAGQAHTYNGLALVADRLGRPAEALRLAELSLELFRAAADQVWEANTLNSVGWCHTQLGDHRQALACCTEALALLQKLGDIDGQANTWDSLGHAHSGLGDHEQAASCYQHAIDLSRDLGDPYFEADTLASLGDTHHAAGDPDAARKAWHQALEILDQLNHPEADQVRTKLNSVGP